MNMVSLPIKLKQVAIPLNERLREYLSHSVQHGFCDALSSVLSASD